MSLPLILQKYIDDALGAMRKHQQFDLDPYYRLVIYQYFDNLSGWKGRIAHTHLSIMAAERVCHLYDVMPEEHGYPTLPRLMISIANQLLTHFCEGVNAMQANEISQEITVEVIFGPKAVPMETHTYTAIELAQLAQEMNVLSGEMPTSLYYQAWCAFLAAKSALDEALGWVEFRKAIIDSTTTNSDLQWNSDTAKWAAIASVGGVWSEFEVQDPSDFVPQGNWDYSSPDTKAKRKEFWEWWCSEAVPAAWRTAQECAGGLPIS